MIIPKETDMQRLGHMLAQGDPDISFAATAELNEISFDYVLFGMISRFTELPIPDCENAAKETFPAIFRSSLQSPNLFRKNRLRPIMQAHAYCRGKFKEAQYNEHDDEQRKILSSFPSHVVDPYAISPDEIISRIEEFSKARSAWIAHLNPTARLIADFYFKKSFYDDFGSRPTFDEVAAYLKENFNINLSSEGVRSIVRRWENKKFFNPEK